MTEIQAVGLYAGVNILLMLFLAANVVRHRRRTSISLGIGTDADLEQAVRAQANCLENAVPGLLALTLLALTGASAPILHGFGVALTFGRLAHAHGLLSQPGRSFGRFYGTLITWVSLLGMAVLLVLTPFIPALQ